MIHIIHFPHWLNVDFGYIFYWHFCIGNGIQRGAIRGSFLSFLRKWAQHLFEDTDGVRGGQRELMFDISAIAPTFFVGGCFRFGPCGQTHTWVTTIQMEIRTYGIWLNHRSQTLPGSFSAPGVATPGLHVLKLCPSLSQLVTIYIVSGQLGAS